MSLKEHSMRTSTSQRKVYVAMGAWDLEPFDKYFYPPKPKKGFRKLQYYSQFFDSVEVNATFYNASFTPAHAKRWLADVAENQEFVFTVKLYRGFTHTFNARGEDVKVIHNFLGPLEEAGKLGGLLLQFPYSFTNIKERRIYLVQLSKVLQPHRLFIEVRHKSWNPDPSGLMYNFFQENKLHLVNVDLPQIGRHMPLTALACDGYAYFRMMGRNGVNWRHPERGDRYLYHYSDEELRHLLSLMEYVKATAHTTFVVFHNDPEANSLVNGFRLRHLLLHGQRVLMPQNMIKVFPQLKAMSAEVNTLHPLFACASDQ